MLGKLIEIVGTTNRGAVLSNLPLSGWHEDYKCRFRSCNPRVWDRPKYQSKKPKFDVGPPYLHWRGKVLTPGNLVHFDLTGPLVVTVNCFLPDPACEDVDDDDLMAAELDEHWLPIQWRLTKQFGEPITSTTRWSEYTRPERHIKWLHQDVEVAAQAKHLLNQMRVDLRLSRVL